MVEEAMTYEYSAYTGDRIINGTIDAASENLAEEALYRAGYQFVISLKKIRPSPSLEELIPSLYGIKSQDMVDFSRQLATLIESGIGLLSALHLLEGHALKPALKRIISGLIDELRAGISFSQAASKYPHAFSDTYCQLIKASEHTGNLGIGLKQIAGYMEKQLALKRRIIQALAYPTLVLVIATGVFALLITVALPPLVGLFDSLRAELPLSTRMVIAISDFLIDYNLYLLTGALLTIVSIIGVTRLPSGKLAVDRLMLKLPAVGVINIQRHMAQFCRTTSMLLGAGLRLPQIMDIATQTIGNRVIRRALGKVREKLIQGQGLSQPMAEIDVFPPLMVEMAVVGENTGTLDSTLSTVADFYEERVDQQIQTLTSLIEPVLTVIIGLAVIFIALSMITPLYSILRSLQ